MGQHGGDYGCGNCQGVRQEPGKTNILHLVKRQEAVHTILECFKT
jgi:hypothetical protein